MVKSLRTIDFQGRVVSVQDIWDALPSIRYNAILFFGISVMMMPIDVLIYYHPVFTTGTLEWKCLPDTKCEHLQSLYNDTGAADVRCIINDPTQWIYTSQQVTVIGDFDWICDKEFYYTLYNSLYFVGYLIGLPFTGSLSDWYGRSSSQMFTAVVVFTALAILSAAPTTTVLFVGQIMLGFGGGSMWLISYTRRMEVTPSQYRNSFMCSLSFIEIISFLFALLLATWLANWRRTLLILALLTTINLLLLVLPESPQYYVAKNCNEKASAILQYIAFNNGAKIENYTLAEKSTETRLSYKDLMFRNKTVAIYFFVMAFAWFSASLISYSVQYIALNLPGDGLLNFVLIMQVPMAITTVLQLIVVECFGRKKVLACSFLLSGLGFVGGIALQLLQIENWILSIGAFGVTKVASGIAFSMVYLMTTELFPTILRQQAMSGCSTVARLGSISGPLFSAFNKAYPLMSVTVLMVDCIIAMILIIIAIPETKGKPLLDSFEDVVNYEVEYERLPLKESSPMLET